MTALNSNATGIEEKGPVLSPWVNGKQTVESGSRSNQMADIYRMCHNEVLRRLMVTPDSLGRSQVWKAKAIADDLADGKDNGYTQWFTKEVIALAEKYFD